MSKAASAALKVGQKAPDFTVLNDQGQKVKLSDFKGKKVIGSLGYKLEIR